ncbi:hypothetical protein G3260_000094 [Streptomyces albus]|uniref:hypothetical protein n=1 Tax=Streptomyces albus TaxID=1888 RepID=UPI0006B59042|nr:hypothetical protein [Streptomyces albus]KPC88295.1 hypothetical protein ADL27_41175 [Streptomyces sp. NRRL F-6602]QID34325.1 hypothetical protein G3260_000094 [Streptomyces albus]
MKALLRSPALCDAVPAGLSAAGVRWLWQTFHTGVSSVMLRLPVGIVAWVYERRPDPGGELIRSFLRMGAVTGGLVVVAQITAAEAATTPAGGTPDHLAVGVQVHRRGFEGDHLARLRQAPGVRSNAHLVALAWGQLTTAQSRPIAMSGAAAS